MKEKRGIYTSRKFLFGSCLVCETTERIGVLTVPVPKDPQRLSCPFGVSVIRVGRHRNLSRNGPTKEVNYFLPRQCHFGGGCPNSSLRFYTSVKEGIPKVSVQTPPSPVANPTKVYSGR